LKWPIEIVNCGAIVPLMILAFPIPAIFEISFKKVSYQAK
jgi:hypothetical protein